MRRFILTAVALVWFVARAGAVDFGWQTVSGGGIEYLVQVEPELIDSFRQEGFTSEVPAGLRDIRRIRITVGKGQLPNQGDLTGPTIAQAAPAAVEPKDERAKGSRTEGCGPGFAARASGYVRRKRSQSDACQDGVAEQCGGSAAAFGFKSSGAAAAVFSKRAGEEHRAECRSDG